MPAFIIAEASARTGQTIAATLCDPGPCGFPDKRSATPVQITLVNERMLAVDGEQRGIISCVGQPNGSVQWLINGSSKAVRHRERRVALAKASGMLQQLRTCLMPLIAISDDGGLATEALQALFDFIRDERELATAAPRSRKVDD